MAKWGEGDPRWIVEERPDAINVNNWHWTEKNACGWSEAKFKELFTGLEIGNDLFKCKIVELHKCKGEAVANNRKGKLIFFYEWELVLKWKGKMDVANDYIKGKIIIPNLSEENEIHEVDVDITTNESNPEGDFLREMMKDLVVSKIREQLSKYVQGLKAEFSQGMILPSKDSNEDTECKDSINSTGGKSKSGEQSNSNAVGPAKSAPNIKTSASNQNTTTLKLSHIFQCTSAELYNALTINELVSAFTHGPADIDLQKGGKFDLFGGNVTGEFIDLIPESKIIQTWRCKRWPSGHYSVVTIDLIQQSDHTEFKLVQTGIPIGEIESLRENWKRYYFDALKTTFGFGYLL